MNEGLDSSDSAGREPLATQGSWAPLVSMSRTCSGNVVQQSQIDIVGLRNILRQNGLTLPKPHGSKEKTRQGIARAAGIRKEDPSWTKVLRPARSSSEPERAQICKAHREKDTAEKKGRRESGEAKGRITNCPCWREKKTPRCNTSSRIPGKDNQEQ